MDKEDVVCLHIYLYTYTQWIISQLLLKKDEIMPFEATWMDVEIVMISEVSQMEEGKYIILFICRILSKCK